MLKGKRIGLVMAMGIEAEPFIKGLGLDIVESKPFIINGKDDVFLIRCGVGRVRAAAAAVHLIHTCSPDIIINAGTAGGNRGDLKAGTIYNINIVFDRDMPVKKGLQSYDLIEDRSVPSASLVSSDRPSISDLERTSAAEVADLSDMEGASIAYVAGRFNIETYIYKIISDSPGLVSRDQLMNNIKRYSEDLFVFFKERFFDKM